MWTKVTGVTVGLLLLANGAAWYQLEVRADRPPSFSRGGRFAAASATPDAAPTTTSTTTPRGTVTTAPPPSVAQSAAGSYAPAQLSGRSTGAPSPGQGGVLPAAGTYTWKVDGTEGATGFGSRRLPDRATIVAHPGAGADAGRVVLDTTYSEDHQERLIVADQAGSLVATYEGGQVRFGPMAQTNTAAYDPAMNYIPADLRASAVTKGTSKGLDGSGKVQRTEAWTLTVVGRTTIPVLGVQTEVWEIVLQRDTLPGSGQEVHRTRRQWWDPNRRMVVRYRDTMHGQQRYGGVTFTFDCDLTADLLGYAR
jgi:hypothetical protein